MASTVDTAITALVTLLADIDGFCLAGSEDATDPLVSVHDGPPARAETADWVAIGFQPGTADSVVIEYDWKALGQSAREERYDILCSLMSASGDEAMSTRRGRALAMRDAVAAALSADYTLGGVVRLAAMSTATLLQEQTTKGALAGYTFTVSVQARITA